MDSQEYERMYNAEDGHWWYRGMASITHAVLDRRYVRGGSLRILDAGCGTGAAATSFLAEYGRVWGMDINAEALRFCRRRGAGRWARASVLHLPCPDGYFHLVTCFDVLYGRAVSSEIEALREFRRVLAAGGRVLLRLPAYEWMRRSHDEVVHTRRRYTRREVGRFLRQSGFTVEWLSHANMLLLPAAALKKITERMFPLPRPKSDLAWNPGAFNGLLCALLSLEAPWVAHTGLPLGLSVIAVGRKP
jgi:ubiquinone/menaquinone biosynthesis C-methylase UbiE